MIEQQLGKIPHNHVAQTLMASSNEPLKSLIMCVVMATGTVSYVVKRDDDIVIYFNAQEAVDAYDAIVKEVDE